MPSVALKESRPCHCDTRIACSHCSTIKFHVSYSCSDCSSDIDAAYLNLVPENGSCRIVRVVVWPVLADQDAFGSSSYQTLPPLCRSSGLGCPGE